MERERLFLMERTAFSGGKSGFIGWRKRVFPFSDGVEREKMKKRGQKIWLLQFFVLLLQPIILLITHKYHYLLPIEADFTSLKSKRNENV